MSLTQIADGKNDIDAYKNGFVNLALPLMAFSSPIESPKLAVHPHGMWLIQYKNMDKIWDRFDFSGRMTLQEFIDHFQNVHGLTVTMVSSNVTLLYNSYMRHKQANRLKMPLKKLVEFVSKKPIPSHQKDLIFEICVDDETDEDVEVPFVKVDLLA
jgi:ubiquitin-activating enzyme E1